MPSHLLKIEPMSAVRGEADQEQVAGHHRRQHQGQVDQDLHEPLAEKMEPGQHVSGGDRKGQAEQGRHQSDLEAQPQGSPFHRAQEGEEEFHDRHGCQHRSRMGYRGPGRALPGRARSTWPFFRGAALPSLKTVKPYFRKTLAAAGELKWR